MANITQNKSYRNIRTPLNANESTQDSGNSHVTKFPKFLNDNALKF